MLILSDLRSAGSAIVAVIAVACGSATGCASADQAEPGRDTSLSDAGPTQVEFNGVAFVPLESLSATEREELRDADMFAKPDTPERMAQRIRWHIMLDNVHYVEATPNLELARQAFEPAEEPIVYGLPSPSMREGRAVNGTDNRNFAVGPNTWPRESVAMSESSGTGTIIGTNRRIYTAAHVVFNNTTGNGWICADGNLWNPNTFCGAFTWSRWRFGMGSGTQQNSPLAETNWLTAPVFSVPNEFINFDVDRLSNGTSTEINEAWFDYAATDFAIGTFSSPPTGMGTMGATALSDANLVGKMTWLLGYPARSNCPNGSRGSSSDCPSGTFELSAGGKPYSWGELMGSEGGTVTTGDSSPSGSLKSTNMDNTAGMSGGPVFAWITNTWFVIGVQSNTQSAGPPAPVGGTVPPENLWA